MADDSAEELLSDEDLGEPIEALRGFDEDVGLGFVDRVVRSLRRRTLSSHVATLIWSGTGEAVREFLELIYSLFGPHDRGRGDSE